jgi:type I restriction enzyme M protein
MHLRFAALLLEGRSRPMPANVTDIEKRLWASADELRANSRLRASEYSAPMLGLIFLRFADQKFAVADADLKRQFAAVAGRPSRRVLM